MQINADAAASVLDELLLSTHQKHGGESSAIVPRKVNVQQPKTKDRATEPAVRPFRLHPAQRDRAGSATQQQTASPEPSTVTGIKAFLENSGGLRVLECKPVEASGTGASSVFLRNTADDSRPQTARLALPFKAWMTKISICPRPYLIFEISQGKLRQQERVLSYLASPNYETKRKQQALVVVSVLFEELSGRPSSGKEFDVTLSTMPELTSSPSTALTSATVASPRELVHLEVPSSALSTFAKVEIKPKTPGTWLVKVSGICVWMRSASLPANDTAPPPLSRRHFHPRDDGLANATISAVDSVSNSSTEEPNRAAYASKTATEQSCSSVSAASTNKPSHGEEVPDRFAGMNVSNEHLKEKSTAHGMDERVRLQSVIAEEMRDKAAFMLTHFPTPSRDIDPGGYRGGQTKRRGSRQDYNWLTDETRSVVASTVTAESETSITSSSLSAKKSKDAEAEFLALVETWEMSPKSSVAQALSFCMGQATAFSFTTAAVDDARGMMSVLCSSFAFNLLQLEGEPAASPSLLEQLFRVMGLCDGLGYKMELISQLPNGFCVSVAGQRSLFGGSLKAKKYVVVVLEGADEAFRALRQSATICFSAGATNMASLRVVLDLTHSFTKILPALADWVKLREIHYYGAERQSGLTKFLSRSCVGKGDTHNRATPARAICYGGFRLSATGIQVEPETNQTEQFLFVVVRQCTPTFFVWQPHQSSPRVVLTNTHLLEHIRTVDGALAPREVAKLAAILFANDSVEGEGETERKILPMSEEPWQKLSLKGQKPEQDPNPETWLETRRRATTKCIFHALSTAFRRDWQTIGITMPYVCCAEGTNPLSLSHGFLDQDALMDTVFRWTFPRPSTVVLFYGHSQPSGDNNMREDPSTYPPFTPEALTHFVRVKDFSAALE